MILRLFVMKYVDILMTSDSKVCFFLGNGGVGKTSLAALKAIHQAESGKKVSVHYEGSLLSGQVFDSSYKRNQPIDFQLGVGQVIPGWDEGIGLLQVGDKARFVIPSDLAYGSAGAGGVIPPNATLIFDVELMTVG